VRGEGGQPVGTVPGGIEGTPSHKDQLVEARDTREGTTAGTKTSWYQPDLDLFGPNGEQARGATS
jgi:hypothetical protein